MFRSLACVLLCAAASAQVAKQASPSERSSSTASKIQPSSRSSSGKESSRNPADPAVITIQGVCAKTSAKAEAAKPAAAPCNTTISQSEFEKIIEAIRPGVSPASQKQFAGLYASGIVMAEYAHKKGLDRGPAFEEMMKLMKIQVMAQETAKKLRSQAALISDKDIQAYYDKNVGNYQEADLERIYIPKTKQLTAKDNQKPDELKKERDESESEMKKEADLLHSRAVAGEEFGKLQTEAFEVAGMKVQSPSTKLSKVRAASFPPEQRSIFNLKPGAVSELISGPSGYIIYKLESKTTLPLTSVREDIHNTLQNQNFQNALQAIQKSAQISFDEAYFKTSAPVPQNALQGAGTRPQAPVVNAK